MHNLNMIQVSGLVKNFNTGILADTISIINVTLCMWYYTLSFTCSLHFQWSWHYFKVTAVSNSLNWKSYVIWLSWNFVGLHWAGHEYTTFFTSALFRDDRHFFFWCDKNIYCWLFHRHCSSEVFQTLDYYNLAWGLPNHTRFDDLDFVSRFQGHRCFRNMNCKLCVLDSCLDSCLL